jgi:hypothetical protein
LKYFLILLFISILFILLYRRLRPYIAAAQQMLGIVRGVRRMNSNQASGPLRRASESNQRLTRCASCNTWIPSARALKSSSSDSSYCSRACLERAAQPIRQKRASSL